MFARILTPLLCVFAIAAYAGDSVDYYGGKSEGWFWYKDPVEKKKQEPKAPAPEKPQEPPKAPPPPKEEVKVKPEDVPFSVAWLKKNYERLHEEAIENPDDPDKVRAFLYVQRIILDKAQNFATAAHLIANTDPLLDETNRVPLDTAAKFAVMRGLDVAKKTALKDLAQKGGIFFFFDSSCAHCKTQQEALGWLAQDYGFRIKNISVDGKGLPGMTNWVKDTGQAKALNLKITPTTMFVVPPDNYYIISQGTHSAETLGEKILLAAQEKKLISPDLAKNMNLFERGVLSAQDMRDPGLLDAVKDSQDSKVWVNRLRERLGTKY